MRLKVTRKVAITRRFGAALALLLIALVASYFVRNPERTSLNDTIRSTTTGKYVRLTDGQTHYEMTGPDTAPTVVLVHGFSVPYYVWDSTVGPLRDAGYRVIRYDLYGRGFSDRPRTTYDATLFTRQLDELLNALHVAKPVHLMGVSMGGWVTASYVAAHPERVRSLTLVDPVARNGRVQPPESYPIIGPLLYQTLDVPTFAANQLTDFVHPERFPDWDDRYVPQTRLRGFGRALLSTRHAMETIDFDTLYTRVARTNVPVLLLWGEKDETVPIGLSTRVRLAIPTLHMVAVKDAGHLPIIEQASVVNPAMLRFLADTLPHPAAATVPK